MSTEWRRWGLLLAALAMTTGCTNPEYVSENPVVNQPQPLKAGVYDVNDVDVRPVATREYEPDYPPRLEPIMTGKALVAFTVRTDGKVEDAAVVQADDVQFGEAALEAIRKWRYRPAQVKGVPVECRMTLPFAFVSPYMGSTQYESMPDMPNASPSPGGPRRQSLDQQ